MEISKPGMVSKTANGIGINIFCSTYLLHISQSIVENPETQLLNCRLFP